MPDMQKQIDYWCKGAEEDWQVAKDLIQQTHVRHGLFFAHLSLEKLLKALVCRRTQELAPSGSFGTGIAKRGKGSKIAVCIN